MSITRSSTGDLMTLLQHARSMLAEIDEPMAASFLEVIDYSVDQPPTVDPRPFPLGAVPDFAALANDQTRAFSSAIHDAADSISWYQSDSNRVPPGWVDRSAATELIAPGATFASPDQSRLGLFYLSPELHYPNHWHNAEEFYLVLGGSVELTVDGDTKTLTPSDYSRTPTLAHHEMVTGSEPMLALWGWAGDTSFESYAY